MRLLWLLSSVTIGGAVLLGCSGGSTSPGVSGKMPPPIAQPVDPTDEADIVRRLQTILPDGWRILVTQRDTYPSFRPPGKGIAVFLAPPVPPNRKDNYQAIVYIMPPDYQDGGPDPTSRRAQSWPARLVATNDRMKIYVWGGWNGAQDPQTEAQVRDALLH